MQTKDQARVRILELCSESEYGSWTFWSEDNKTEDELMSILEAIRDLVIGHKIEVFEHKVNGPYEKVSFDAERLRTELKRSMTPNVDPNTFYWFAATDAGKKEYDAWAKEYWTEERIVEQKEKWKKWSKNGQ
jgi:hypothetical protein